MESREKEKKSKWSRKGIAGFAIGFVLCFAACLLVDKFVTTNRTVDDDKVYSERRLGKILRNTVEQFNTATPLRVDEYTTVVSADFLPPDTIRYNYRMGLPAADIDRDIFFVGMEPMLATQIATNPAMKAYRTNRVKFVYSYIDSNGQFFARIVVTPEQYNSVEAQQPAEQPDSTATESQEGITIEQFTEGGEFKWE